MNWSASQEGDCLSVRFGKNSSSSLFSKTDCAKKQNFVCEVSLMLLSQINKNPFKKQMKKSGSFGQALQNECMEVWNVSAGIKTNS